MTAVTAKLREALRDRYPPPEWVLAFEVQTPADDGGLRFADAVAFDTRKGAGMGVSGFELKVSRADWLHELSDPEKSKPARAMTDFWWVVVGGPGIVEKEELPAGVGLLEAGLDGDLKVRVIPSLKTETVHDSMSRRFFAAVLRRVDPLEPRAYWESKVRQAEQKGFQKGMGVAKRAATSTRLRGRERPDDGPLDLP